MTDDENGLIFDLITLRAVPSTSAGVKFVSLGLSVLVACSSALVASPSAEKRTAEWVRWLLDREEANKTSFGEKVVILIGWAKDYFSS